jgi:SSS family solute:Na+ symporter
MNLTLFLIVLFVLQLVCLVAGSKASRGMKDQEDYFLAGKDVRFFPLMMTFIATQIGGGLVLGSSEEAYHFGWSVMLYPLGACLGFVLLAIGIGKKLAQFQVSTVAQLFEVVYRSSALKRVASFLSIVSLFMILVAQVIASKKFMLSLGFDQNALFLLFWGLIILYTVLGGLKAVVSIDIIQATFFIIVFLLGFGYTLYVNDVSFFNVVEAGLNKENFDLNSSKLCGWLLMPLLFMVIEQDMAQRCFAAQSPRIVTKAAAYAAGCTLLVCIIPIFFGILGKSKGIQVAKGASVFMTVAQATTTPAISAFLGCAVLAAIISTAISLINAVSSNVNQDFALMRQNQSAFKSRWITALIGLGALLFSFYFDNVVDLLIQSYELSICCLFVPVFVALFKQSGNKISAILAIVGGFFGFCLFRLVPVTFPKEILSILLSFIGYVIGEMIVWTQNRQIAKEVGYL